MFIVFILALFPVSYVTFKNYMNFDNMSAILALIIVIYLIIRNKKILDFQIMLHISKIPILYAILWRTKFGLNFMDKIATKYREFVKLLGYCFIGFGFFGLIFVSINIIFMLYNLFLKPIETSQSVALVLPLTNIPGLGYLSFWHFFIAIFVTVLVHEFAHGIVARAHNVPIKSSGLGVFSILLPIFPLAFVEPDEKKLEKEKDVVQYSIFAAGPMVNIILAFLLSLLIINIVNPIYTDMTHPIGFSFSGLSEGHPAQQAGMKPRMIITEVNGVEMTHYENFSTEFEDLKPGDMLNIITDQGQFNIETVESPDNPSKGFIGIQGISNEREINPGFENYGPIYFWFKDLLKWLFILNFIIGLMNLLPLIITDGGRMLKTALSRIVNNQEKANKVWIYIGVIFIFTLLSAMVIRYGQKLLVLFGIG